jgi:hypothetical protein
VRSGTEAAEFGAYGVDIWVVDIGEDGERLRPGDAGTAGVAGVAVGVPNRWSVPAS